MEYRYLGKSGLKVSAIGLGTNNFGRRLDADASALVINHALDMGVNMIDTSNSYGGGYSEEYIGLALKGKRDQAIIATKVSSTVGEGPNDGGNSRQHIIGCGGGQPTPAWRRIISTYTRYTGTTRMCR